MERKPIPTSFSFREGVRSLVDVGVLGGRGVGAMLAGLGGMNGRTSPSDGEGA